MPSKGNNLLSISGLAGVLMLAAFAVEPGLARHIDPLVISTFALAASAAIVYGLLLLRLGRRRARSSRK